MDKINEWYFEEGNEKDRDLCFTIIDKYMREVVAHEENTHSYEWLMRWIQGVLFDADFKSYDFVILCGNPNDGKRCLIRKIFCHEQYLKYSRINNNVDLSDLTMQSIFDKKLLFAPNTDSYKRIKEVRDICIAPTIWHRQLYKKREESKNVCNVIGISNHTHKDVRGVVTFNLIGGQGVLTPISNYHWYYFVMYFWDRRVEV